MKKLLSIILLQGALLLNAMEQSKGLPITGIIVYNNSKKSISVVTTEDEKDSSTSKSQIFKPEGLYKLAHPIVAMVISEYSLMDKCEITTEVSKEHLAKIANSGIGEITISPIPDNKTKFPYIINELNTLTLLNLSDKKLTLNCLKASKTTSKTPTKPTSWRVGKKGFNRVGKIPLSSLSISETGNSTQTATSTPTREISPAVLKELSESGESSALMLIRFDSQANAFFYELIIYEGHFISDPETIELLSSSSHSKEDEFSTPQASGGGLDVDSGDQKNCIVS